MRGGKECACCASGRSARLVSRRAPRPSPSAGRGPDKAADIKASIDISKPKNIILFIGDGMGEQEVTSGRYYGKGATGRLNMDALKLRGDVTTYNVGPAAQAPYPPNYVPDSAPTASAWSSGIKTLDGRLGQGPSSGVTVPGTNFKTYMEIARDRGMATGNVSTAEITDATPAGPSSHISQRGCHGPNDTRTACPTETKAAGGLGSIAEQQADEKFDVVLGGGRARYPQPLDAGGTKNVIDYAKEKGYKYVATEAELNGVTSLAPGERLLGLFHDSNMTTEFNPLIASDTGAGSPTTKCTPANRGNEPTLGEMTEKAIRLLQGDSKGFVLQVEGASIDKRDHSADACGQIGELLGMDDAIGVAQEFQRTHPDTLVVVTADHSHTSQIIPVNQTPRGAYTTLQTVDGSRSASPTARLRSPAARPTRAPRSRSSPPARGPPTSSARSTRPSCSRSSPTPRPPTAAPRRSRRQRCRRQRAGHAPPDDGQGAATFAPSSRALRRTTPPRWSRT